MRTLVSSLAFASLLSFAACVGKDDTAADSESDVDSDTDVDADTDSDSDQVGFRIEGYAVDLLTAAPVAEGLCVHAADPTLAMAGGDLEILSSCWTSPGGFFVLSQLETTSEVGLFLLVQDCDDAATVLPTATGLPLDAYEGLGDGDNLTVGNIFSIDIATAMGLSGWLDAAGYTGDLLADGALVGFVTDASGNPVDGAIVSGSDVVFYFTGSGFNNDGTLAAAGAMFVIPGAPFHDYSCEADGFTFDPVMAGSLPGYAVVLSFIAN